MNKVMTRNGDMLDVLNPDPDMLTLSVIAHHLSMQCRYNGACYKFYSVAEHSVIGALAALREFDDTALARAFLLHDAHEAFLGDIVTPLKPALVDSVWWHAADALDLAIQTKYDVSFDDPRIKMIDDHMLASEWFHNMPHKNRYNSRKMTGVPLERFGCLDPVYAKRSFLSLASKWWAV